MSDGLRDEGESWFHELKRVPTRQKAEDLLLEAGFEHGLFLVRESTSAEGDFVLSVVRDQEVIHYQLRKRADDALFSLAEQPRVIQGLDELIHYYWKNPNSGLQHPLIKYVEGKQCPEVARLNGTQNLLHRATANNNLPIVLEILNCGYRNITARDDHGQTAAHVASSYGYDDILKVLMSHGASPLVTDSSGNTPLHLACEHNRKSTINILLENRADPTTQNQKTGWVSLHVAAFYGHLEIAQTLLGSGAPARPRTKENTTPADIARRRGFTSLVQFLDNYDLSLTPKASASQWLHSLIGRVKAIELLRDNAIESGTFLIRRSAKRKKSFVLSLFYDWQSQHYEIMKQGRFYFLARGPYMISLEHLVDHYTRFADGLSCQLRNPVPPSTVIEPPPPRVSSRELNSALPSRLKSIDGRNVYENDETLRRVRHSQDKVQIESVRWDPDYIGKGEFGYVYRGEYQNQEGVWESVAVKKLIPMDGKQAEDIFREADIMLKLDHHCIIQLKGITEGTQIMLLLELAPFGSLLDYITNNVSSISTTSDIPTWAAQIACGMEYLESQRFVHRDLAARNILLVSKFQAKISDFGLTRTMNENNYYRTCTGGRWPIRWYAPECIQMGKFTHMSDVWSYGVLLWEMYTFGGTPYELTPSQELFSFIETGGRLSSPQRAQLDEFETMRWCWEEEPKNRPSFSELFNFFANYPEYVNLTDALKLQDFRELGLS
eukprot:maker-scaffold628_size122696-snap-gene-0.27 protein:Tk01147 transcript:maker-scaffold628_size122696-snap-gene-0.27-mRNA-1 annotation:"tyrosine-protein kinase shark"